MVGIMTEIIVNIIVNKLYIKKVNNNEVKSQQINQTEEIILPQSNNSIKNNYIHPIKDNNFFTDNQIKNGKIIKHPNYSNIKVRDQILINDVLYDIDLCTKNDILFCTQYINDIYDNFDKLEQMLNINNIMKDQEYINDIVYKNIILKIANIHFSIKCDNVVLHLTVSYINRYLSVIKNISLRNFELLALTAFFLASKIENNNTIKINKLLRLNNNLFKHSEIKSMEFNIVDILNFNLTLPTSLTFVLRYLVCSRPLTKDMVYISFFIIERVLDDANFSFYLPSIVAASAIFIMREIYKYENIWSNTLIYYTKYKFSDIQQCIEDIKNILYNKDKDNIICIEYSSEKFNMVAKKFDIRP